MKIISKIGDTQYIDRVNLIGTAKISFIGFVFNKTDSLTTCQSSIGDLKSVRMMSYTGEDTMGLVG